MSKIYKLFHKYQIGIDFSWLTWQRTSMYTKVTLECLCRRFFIPIRHIKFAYRGWNMRGRRRNRCWESSANEYREINWANLHINFFLALITWKSHQLVSARTCTPTPRIEFIWLIDWLADWLHTSEVSSHIMGSIYGLRIHSSVSCMKPISDRAVSRTKYVNRF